MGSSTSVATGGQFTMMKSGHATKIESLGQDDVNNVLLAIFEDFFDAVGKGSAKQFQGISSGAIEINQRQLSTKTIDGPDGFGKALLVSIAYIQGPVKAEFYAKNP